MFNIEMVDYTQGVILQFIEHKRNTLEYHWAIAQNASLLDFVGNKDTEQNKHT